MLLVRVYRWLWALALLLTLAACQERGRTPQDFPTRVPSVDALATAQVLTQNAPPEGFRESVAFPQIDANLPLLSAWHYEVLLQFDGVFAQTPRRAEAFTRASVWYRQLGNHRRVLLESGGDLVEGEGITALEGVRLGDDTFLVRDGLCLPAADASAAADLRAGDLIGGVRVALPAGVRATINGEAVWRYDFTVDDLLLPQVRLGDNGRITAMSGELWIAPEHNAVVRYYVNLDVENVVLTLFEDALPVSGQLILRYDLFEVGTDPNITQPFGC